MGLGSVAGALGIGGVAGQIASDVRVGGGSNHSVSKTYSQQRVIAIPPHANRNLTNEKWVKSRNGNLLRDAEYTNVEEAETFDFSLSTATAHGLKRGLVERGEMKTYSENDSPLKIEYIVTYSTEEDFSTYSTVNADLFLHEIIGCSGQAWAFAHERIQDFNEYTLMGTVWTEKD